jgi:hypothetical protein
MWSVLTTVIDSHLEHVLVQHFEFVSEIELQEDEIDRGLTLTWIKFMLIASMERSSPFQGNLIVICSCGCESQ